MHNPRLASRYAKSLVDLAVERNELEAVYADMKYLRMLCKQSRDFVNLLRSPVISIDKKSKAITAVTKGNVSELTAAFIRLLINKKREASLPEIADAFINQYNKIKGIHKVKLTTAIEASDDLKNAIINKIKRETSIENIELETFVKEELVGGFVLEFDNNLVDASILRDLRDLKKQFETNEFVHQIR